MREHLPRRLMDLLASTREVLMKRVHDVRTRVPTEKHLAAELSQGSDARYCFRDEEKIRPFHLLLRRRMEQLSLSSPDVAVSLGSTLQYVTDLRSGVRTPTEERVVEFARLLGVTQESLRAAVKEQVNGVAVLV